MSTAVALPSAPQAPPARIDLVEKARTLVITTPQQYVEACEAKLALEEMIADRHANHDPVCQKAFETHKAAVAARKADIDPLEAAKAIYDRAIDGWRREQERIAQEQARRDREMLELQAAMYREQEIIEAEAAGASVVEVEALIERPVYVPPVVVRTPTAMVPKVQGIRKRPDNWKAILDPHDNLAKSKLLNYISRNPQFLGLVKLDETAANQLARAMKTSLVIPGLKIYNDNA